MREKCRQGDEDDQQTDTETDRLIDRQIGRYLMSMQRKKNDPACS